MPNAPVSDTTVVLNCHNIINATERSHIPSGPSKLWQELFGSLMDHQPMFCIFIICKKGQNMQLTQLRKLTTLKRNVEWWMENTRSAACEIGFEPRRGRDMASRKNVGGVRWGLLPSAYYLPCLGALMLLPSLTHSFKCCNIDNRATDMHCGVLCFHSVVVS